MEMIRHGRYQYRSQWNAKNLPKAALTGLGNIQLVELDEEAW